MPEHGLKSMLRILRTSLVVQWLRLYSPNAHSHGQELDPMCCYSEFSCLQLKDPACHYEDQRPHVQQLRLGTAR